MPPRCLLRLLPESLSRQQHEVVDISIQGARSGFLLSLYRASAPRLSFSGRVEVLVQASVRVVFVSSILDPCFCCDLLVHPPGSLSSIAGTSARMEVVSCTEHSLRRPNVLGTRSGCCRHVRWGS